MKISVIPDGLNTMYVAELIWELTFKVAPYGDQGRFYIDQGGASLTDKCFEMM